MKIDWGLTVRLVALKVTVLLLLWFCLLIPSGSYWGSFFVALALFWGWEAAAIMHRGRDG